MVLKNNIGKDGIKDFFKGGGNQRGGDKYPLRTMLSPMHHTGKAICRYMRAIQWDLLRLSEGSLKVYSQALRALKFMSSQPG